MISKIRDANQNVKNIIRSDRPDKNRFLSLRSVNCRTERKTFVSSIKCNKFLKK